MDPEFTLGVSDCKTIPFPGYHGNLCHCESDIPSECEMYINILLYKIMAMALRATLMASYLVGLLLVSSWTLTAYLVQLNQKYLWNLFPAPSKVPDAVGVQERRVGVAPTVGWALSDNEETFCGMTDSHAHF